MLKRNCTLATQASWAFLTLCLTTGVALGYSGFKPIYFNGDAARWKRTTPIRIEMDPNFGNNFDSSGCDKTGGSCVSPRTAVQRALNAWKNVSNTTLSVDNITSKTISTTPHYDNINQIKFYGSGWLELPFAPPSSALAVTISTYEGNTIVDSDIFINGEFFNWAVVDTGSEHFTHDIQNVMAHELGHFFGLDHSSETSNEPDRDLFEATMFFASYAGETARRSLEIGDMNGLSHLYTEENFPTPEFAALSPNEVQINYLGKTTFEIKGANFLPTAAVMFTRTTDDGDVVGQIQSLTDDTIVVSFDVSNMLSGDYDLVVANSFDKLVRVDNALTIQNSTVEGIYSDEQAVMSNGGGCQSNTSSPVLLLLLASLFAARLFRRAVGKLC